MPGLKMSLLGEPRIEQHGSPIKVDTRKAIALLAYLAVTEEAHSRDSLAALLWPESDTVRARAALRRTLSALNTALAGEALLADRQHVRVELGPSDWLDVGEFRTKLAECGDHGHAATQVCSLCLRPLQEAVEVYRNDFLTGFSLRDSASFDEWQVLQSEAFRRELAGALGRLVLGCSERAEFDRAIGYGRRWLALDSLHEPAHRSLMKLYAWSGQRNAGLRQYRDCVRVLEKELGVAPLEETNQLYEAIKENRLSPPAGASAVDLSPSPQPSPSLVRPPAQTIYPMVGRVGEWAAMLEVYDAVGAGGRFLVLEGEAGIGKTRLAEAFLEHQRHNGVATLTARCYEGEANLAYGPFVECLRAALALHEDNRWLDDVPEHWLAESTRLVPEVADLLPGLPSPPALDSPGAQSRFFQGVSQALFAVCGPRGVLHLDDLHWADEASLDLLTYMVRRIGDRPLFILGTWRSESVPAGHDLRGLLAETQRSGTGTLIELSRLGPPEVAELVASVRSSGVDVPKELDERLYQEAEGIPFFVVQYLSALPKTTEGDSAENWTLPAGIRDLLRSRLGAVSETGRQLLSTAAVIGRAFSFEVLREASGRGEEETVTALEELAAKGLVVEVAGSDGPGSLAYDFSHESMRTLVYDETSLARRRLLHHRVADALVARGRGRRDIGELAGKIADHYQLAGLEAQASEYFRLAGEHARALYANGEAVSHFRTALGLGAGDSEALHEAIGDLQTLSGQYDAALRSYETAAALCDSSAIGYLEHKLGNVYNRRGEWDLAASHLEAAGAALLDRGSSEALARLYAHWSLTAQHQGDADAALEHARRALELAESAGDTNALAQAHNILGMLAKGRGDLDTAFHHLGRSLAQTESLGELSSARVAALNNLALASAESGQADRALELLQTALTLCTSQGDRHREAALHNNLADLLHRAGQSEASMSHLKHAVTIFAEIGEEMEAMQPEIWKLVEW